MTRFSERIRSEIEINTRDAIHQQLFAGAVIRLEQDGEALYEKAFGFSLKTPERQVPMGNETVFDLASLTKLYINTVILKLVSEGKLELDVPLADAADGKLAARLLESNDGGSMPHISAMLNQTTTRDLLTHASGIHYWYPFYAFYAPQQTEKNFAAILESVLSRFPRQKKTIYSDINFMVAGMLVEQASGMPLMSAMDRLVCKPLALDSCTYRPVLPFTQQCAATEFGNRIEMNMVAELGLEFSGWRPLDRPIMGEADDGNCHYFFSGIAGHAGLFANARDVCRLGTLYAGTSKSDFLPDTLLREATTDFGDGRGLGFQCGPRYPNGCGHTGFTGTFLYINPSRKISLSILTNRLHVPEPRNIDPYRAGIVEAVLNCL